MWNTLQPGQLWTEARFSAYNSNNHGLYNKLTRAVHAVTRIRHVSSAPTHTNQKKYKLTFSSSKGEKGDLDLFPMSKKPSTETLAFNPCNSCNLQFIVDFPPRPLIFPDLSFRVNNHVCLLCCALFSLTFLIPTQLLPRLWGESTVWSFMVENLHHKLVLSLRSEVPILKSLLC